jgi:general secretion pathway protein I
VRAEHISQSRRPGGFTLIEVLAALIIVSLGMLGVIQAVGQTASNSTYLRDKTLAHWIAMNRLTEVRLQRSPPKVDKTSDEVEMAGRRWRWTMEVTQTPVDSIRRIDISVRPLEANEKSSLASVSGFFGTAIAPPGSTLVSWQGQPGGGQGGQGQDDEQDDGEEEDDRSPDPRNPGTPPRELIDTPTEEPPPPDEE